MFVDGDFMRPMLSSFEIWGKGAINDYKIVRLPDSDTELGDIFAAQAKEIERLRATLQAIADNPLAPMWLSDQAADALKPQESEAGHG